MVLKICSLKTGRRVGSEDVLAIEIGLPHRPVEKWLTMLIFVFSNKAAVWGDRNDLDVGFVVSALNWCNQPITVIRGRSECVGCGSYNGFPPQSLSRTFQLPLHITIFTLTYST